MRILVPSFRKQLRLISGIITTTPRVVSRGVRAIHHVDPRIHDTTGCRIDLSILTHVTTRNIITGANVVMNLNRAIRRIYRLVSSIQTTNISILAVKRCLRPDQGGVPMGRCIAPRRFRSCGSVTLRGKFGGIRDTPLIHSSCRTRGRM